MIYRLQLMIFNFSKLHEMLEQADFEWFIPMNRHGDPRGISRLDINMVAPLKI